MTTYLFIALIFAIFFFTPLAVSYFAQIFDEEELFIPHFNTKDPRFFAKSFRRLFNEAFSNYEKSGSFKLSQDEAILFADRFDWIKSGQYDSVIYSEDKNFNAPDNSVFNKEIYSKGNFTVGKASTVRAIASDKELRIHSESEVVRWIDSLEKLVVEDHVRLGMSTTSETVMELGTDITFKRLYAPKIILGKTKAFKEPSINKEFEVFDELKRDINTVSKDDMEKGKYPYTIISKDDFIVQSGVSVHGAITSHKGLVLEEDAVVFGNVFAEEDVILKDGARVHGLLFTQGSIFIGNNCVVGKPDEIKSIVARDNITFGTNNVVYGYIGTEKEGIIQ